MRWPEADLKPRGRVFPSRAPDRLQRWTRRRDDALFDPIRSGQFATADKAAWMASGTRSVGGTIQGIASKLDYLQGLGVTTIWINPPW